MISQAEKERLKEFEQAFYTQAISLAVGDVVLSPEEAAEYVGSSMAVWDALFAIREGATWRNISDPKEIARVVLRQTEFGD